MIRLVQYLCPEQHCIIAAAYDSDLADTDTTINMLLNRLRELRANPYCGICGSKELKFEVRNTTFEDLETAMPILRKAERDNKQTKEMLDAAGLSYDSKQKKGQL